MLTYPKTSPLTFYRFLGRLMGILTMGCLWLQLGQWTSEDGNLLLERVATAVSCWCFGWFVIFLSGALEELLVLTLVAPSGNDMKSWIHVEILTDACWGRLVSILQRMLHGWRYRGTEDDDALVRHDEHPFVHDNGKDKDSIITTGSKFDPTVLYE